MVHWLYPANTKFFDVIGAFNQPATFWPVHSKVSPKDYVYFYLAAPFKQIGFGCEVKGVGVSRKAALSAVEPFFKQKPGNKNPEKLFMEVTVRKRIPLEKNSLFSLPHLRENGLKGMLMGPRKLENSPALLTYLKERMNELP